VEASLRPSHPRIILERVDLSAPISEIAAKALKVSWYMLKKFRLGVGIVGGLKSYLRPFPAAGSINNNVSWHLEHPFYPVTEGGS